MARSGRSDRFTLLTRWGVQPSSRPISSSLNSVSNFAVTMARWSESNPTSSIARCRSIQTSIARLVFSAFSRVGRVRYRSGGNW